MNLRSCAWLAASVLASGAAAQDAAVPAGRCAGKPQVDDWGGAYYRKIVGLPGSTSRGIAAELVLPRFAADPARAYSPKSPALAWQLGPLDRASAYLGGNGAGKELDAGLTWRRVYDDRARPAFTDRADGSDGRDPRRRFFAAGSAAEPTIEDGTGAAAASGARAVAALMEKLRPDFAFRPFWRTTNGGGNQWNPAKEATGDAVYFYPGEAVSMRLTLASDETFRMEIAAESGGSRFATTFRQEGFRAGPGAPAHVFKRVNSIDQYALVDGAREGNEHADVIPTKAEARGLRWDRVSVLEETRDAPLAGAGCVEIRGHDTNPAYARVFLVADLTPEGGESVDIIPQGLSSPP
jgi:hypothetical protein